MGFKSAKNGSDLNKTLQLLHELARYTVPSDDSKIRARIGFAFSCLVFSKGANLLTPLFYGATVDLVNSSSGFAVTAFFFLVGGYALARLGQVVFNEAKQYLFAKVAQRAVRGAALQAFRHLHSLSLKFHMDRQTGGLSRAIDRGAKAIEFLLTMAFFEVLPLFIEVVFVTILMWYMFGGATAKYKGKRI